MVKPAPSCNGKEKHPAFSHDRRFFPFPFYGCIFSGSPWCKCCYTFDGDCESAFPLTGRDELGLPAKYKYITLYLLT